MEEGVGEVLQAQAALDAVYAAYAEEDADFDALAKQQERLEAVSYTHLDVYKRQVLALAAIGLSANLQHMRATGPRPVLLGLGVWLAVALGSLAVQVPFIIRF